jgi:desampylase
MPLAAAANGGLNGEMSLQIALSVISTIAAAARNAFPHEACGILFGRQGHVESALITANVATDPTRHFEVDPAALVAAHKGVRSGGAQVIGYFHSHPNGLARPSATDAATSARDGAVWVIAAPDSDGSWGITCWHDGTGGFERLSYGVSGG